MPSYSHFLGEYNGKIYRVSVRPDPAVKSSKDEDFCITLLCRNPETMEDEEVVTLDTAHGYVHIDLKFREHPFKAEKISLENLDYWDAYEKVVDNWKEFAVKHERKRRE